MFSEHNDLFVVKHLLVKKFPKNKLVFISLAEIFNGYEKMSERIVKQNCVRC